MTDMTTTRWTVDITMAERDGHTHAEARLHTRDTDHLSGTGVARVRPADPDVPEIGEELAAARALHDLAEHLLRTAQDDIEGVTHKEIAVDR